MLGSLEEEFMYEDNNKYESVTETDPNEVKKIIIDLILSEDYLDEEESNPFKPITIANRHSGIKPIVQIDNK